MKDMTPYRKMAESIGFGDSELMPKMFAAIADEDEAKVILAASPPATLEELAEKTALPVQQVEKLVEDLFEKGLIYKSKKPDATRYYKFRKYIQFHDGTVLTPGISQEYLDLWKKFEATEMRDRLEKVKELQFRQGMRVVPVNVTIESQTQVLAVDDVNQMIEAADRIAVTNCSCRTIHPTADVSLEVCMQLNKAADYALERGTGRELTKEEAIDMLRMCEEEGLVHCVDNTRSLGFTLCNCDRDICGNWGHDRAYAKTFCAPSRFRASVDAETCVACGACEERCFFDAVSMAGEEGTAVVDEGKCMGCGICLPACPVDAINYEEISAVDSIPE
jgi:ferredoxin